MELFQKHLERLTAAVTLQKPDRVPVIMSADAFCAQVQGVTLADYLSDMVRASEIHIKTFSELGEIDGTEYMLPVAQALGAFTLMDVKLPGKQLPPNALWQVEEIGPMTLEDYDIVLEKGWAEFTKEILPKRLPNSFAEMMNFVKTDFNKVAMNYIQAGIVPAVPAIAAPPIEKLSPARGMANFLKDMFRMPDKLEAIMQMMIEEEIASIKQQIQANKPFSVFISGARGAGEHLSPKFWNRFVFPYIKQLVEAIVAEGSFAFLHFDSNWERDLDQFKELPKGKCIFASDHATDMFTLKKTLDGHMCLYGDVPAALLALGAPDEVYNYSRRLVTELGPAGLILGAGCVVPFNAKFENVKAMVAAATGK